VGQRSEVRASRTTPSVPPVAGIHSASASGLTEDCLIIAEPNCLPNQRSADSIASIHSPPHNTSLCPGVVQLEAVGIRSKGYWGLQEKFALPVTSLDRGNQALARRARINTSATAAAFFPAGVSGDLWSVEQLEVVRAVGLVYRSIVHV
jgi:hypothetical protein